MLYVFFECRSGLRPLWRSAAEVSGPAGSAAEITGVSVVSFKTAPIASVSAEAARAASAWLPAKAGGGTDHDEGRGHAGVEGSFADVAERGGGGGTGKGECGGGDGRDNGAG